MSKSVERDNNFARSFLRYFKYLVDQVRKLGKLLERDLKQLPLGVEIHVVSRVDADEAGMEFSGRVESPGGVLPATPKILGVYSNEGEVLREDVFHQRPVLSSEQTTVT